MALLDEVGVSADRAEVPDRPWYRERSTWIAVAGLVIFVGVCALGFLLLGSPSAGAAGGCGGG